jgi:hypothetical protein
MSTKSRSLLPIAIRKHVNQIKKPVAVAKELQPLVEEMVKAGSYSKPVPVGVPAMKDRDGTLFSDSFALALDAARQAKAELKTTQLALMIEDGSFKAMLKNKPSTRRKNTRKPHPQTKRAMRTQPTQAELRGLDNATNVICGINFISCYYFSFVTSDYSWPGGYIYFRLHY